MRITPPAGRTPEGSGPRDADPADAVFDELVREGLAAWRAFAERSPAFPYWVPADYAGALECLRALGGAGRSFVELGSGVGVIAILADLLGYEAYGVELEPDLVRASVALAERFGSDATFVEGSFVPLDYRDEVEHLSADFLTRTEGADAWEELGLSLGDFDVVYAYPWPGEEDWLFELARRHAGRAVLVTYSVADGFVAGPAAEGAHRA